MLLGRYTFEWAHCSYLGPRLTANIHALKSERGCCGGPGVPAGSHTTCVVSCPNMFLLDTERIVLEIFKHFSSCNTKWSYARHQPLLSQLRHVFFGSHTILFLFCTGLLMFFLTESQPWEMRKFSYLMNHTSRPPCPIACSALINGPRSSLFYWKISQVTQFPVCSQSGRFAQE